MKYMQPSLSLSKAKTKHPTTIIHSHNNLRLLFFITNELLYYPEPQFQSYHLQASHHHHLPLLINLNAHLPPLLRWILPSRVQKAKPSTCPLDPISTPLIKVFPP